jgi:hypothetical protein
VLSAALLGLGVTTALIPTSHSGPGCGDRPTIAVAFGGSTADADVAGWCESVAQSFLWFQTVTMLIAPAVLLGWWWRGYQRARRSPTSVRPCLLHRSGPRLWPLIMGALLVLLAVTWSFAPVDEDYQYSCDVRPLITLAAGLEDAAPAVCRDLARDEMTGVPLWSLGLGVPLLVWGDRGRRNAARPDRRTHGAFLSLLTRAPRGVSIAMVCGVGVLFVLLPEPDLVVTSIGTAAMISTWTWGVRRLRATAEAPHRRARLVTKRALGEAGWECIVDVMMEDGAVQRLPLHVENAKPPAPPAEFQVAMLPTGKLVRVSKYEQLGMPLAMFAVGAFLCVAGLHGVGVVELVQDG